MSTMINNTTTNKLAETFSGAMTLGKVAQNLRHLDKVIDTYDGSETAVMLSGMESMYIAGVNGIPVEINGDTGLVHLKDFRETLGMARAVNPDKVAILNCEDGDRYVTNVTVEVFNLDENYPDGELGCRVLIESSTRKEEPIMQKAVILPKLPTCTWEENLKRYGDDDYITHCVCSSDVAEHLFGCLLDELKQLDEADLELVRKYQNDLLEYARRTGEDLSVSMEDLVSDARRILIANGVDY